MALFGGKKKIEEKVSKPTKAVVATSGHTGVTHVRKGVASEIIVRPRVTEKTHFLVEGSNVYTFNVKLGATKGMVEDAIKDLYKISPVKVSIMPIPKKRRFVRGRRGVAGGGRKAYVYLRKGEKIEVA